MAVAPPLERCVKTRNLTVLLVAMLLAPLSAFAALYAVIVEGLGGAEQYASQFHEQVETIKAATQPLATGGEVRVFTGDAATRDAIQAHLRSLAGKVRRDDRVAVYLIGHGSFDGEEFKFNIPGPDLTGQDLRRLLEGLPTENQLLVSTGSASGSLADVLKKESRVLITGTRSGTERNATRFGGDFAAAFKDPSADTDKNGSINAQEAFEFASRRVDDFYKRETRIASEHPRIEGTRAERFTVAQLSSTVAAAQSTSPERQQLAAERDAINGRVEELRLRKEQMEESAYLADLEKLLLELAAVEEKIDTLDGAAEQQPGSAGGATNAPQG
jgi:Peptidase C13 family